MLRLGFLIQALTIFNLVVQSIAVPLYIGFDEYGLSVYVLAPCLIAAALYEPIAQHVSFSLRDSIEISFKYLVWFLLLILVVQLGFGFLSDLDYFLFLFSMLCGMALLCSVFSQSIAYANGRLLLIAKAHFYGLLTFVFLAIFLIYLDVSGAFVYLGAFGGAQIAILLSISCREKKVRLKISDLALFTWDRSLAVFFFEALAWRSFFILFSVGFVWVVAFLNGTESAGQMKILFSVLLGLRYLYPVNTPMFHSIVQEDLEKAFKLLYVMFFLYVSAGAGLLWVGEPLVRLFDLSEFTFLFDMPLFYYSIPVLVSGMAMGSILLRLVGPLNCLALSSAAFLLSAILLFFSKKIDLVFSFGMAFYVMSFMAFIFWRRHAYMR